MSDVHTKRGDTVFKVLFGVLIVIGILLFSMFVYVGIVRQKGFMKEMDVIFKKWGSYFCGYSIDMNFTDISGVYFRSTRRKTYSTDRQRLWEGQNGKCHWCDKQCVFYETEGSALFTVDHVIPLSNKGTNHWMNLVGSFWHCNYKRNKEWQNYVNVSFNKPIETDEIAIPTYSF